eukprot:symbB.v1.2.006179.t1/scaffold367.1/size382069/12
MQHRFAGGKLEPPVFSPSHESREVGRLIADCTGSQRQQFFQSSVILQLRRLKVETQRSRLQAEVNELQASYVSLEAEADAERSKNLIAEQTLQERDVRVADLIKDIQKYRSENRALKDQALEIAERLSELEKEKEAREAELMADIQKLQSENDELNDEAFELAEQLTELGKERWLLSLDARLEEEMASWFVGNMWN